MHLVLKASLSGNACTLRCGPVSPRISFESRRVCGLYVDYDVLGPVPCCYLSVYRNAANTYDERAMRKTPFLSASIPVCTMAKKGTSASPWRPRVS